MQTRNARRDGGGHARTRRLAGRPGQCRARVERKEGARAGRLQGPAARGGRAGGRGQARVAIAVAALGDARSGCARRVRDAARKARSRAGAGARQAREEGEKARGAALAASSSVWRGVFRRRTFQAALGRRRKDGRQSSCASGAQNRGESRQACECIELADIARVSRARPALCRRPFLATGVPDPSLLAAAFRTAGSAKSLPRRSRRRLRRFRRRSRATRR